MGERVKFSECNTSSSMGQTSSQDWKDEVTSSVLHNFVPSVSINSELHNHHHSLFSSTQGCSFIEKHSPKTACAKDLLVHEGSIFLNRLELSVQKNSEECNNDNHSNKCFGHRRHRRYTWPGMPKALAENYETNPISDYCSIYDGNFQRKIRKCKSTLCLGGTYAQSHSTNNSSSSCLATYERKKITEGNHIKFGCLSLDCPSSSICGVEYSLSSTSESTLISTEDTNNNDVSRLENDSLNSNSTPPPLFLQENKFYNMHREHFITDVISNVQKFAKENLLGPDLSKYAGNCNDHKLVFNSTSFHNVVHEKMDGCLKDKNDVLSNSTEQPSLESSKSIKVVATRSDVKKKNELEKLYDSLREIRWAQNITAKSLMMQTKLRRHSVRIAGEASRKAATLSTMYKRVLPNRAIRKGEGVGGRATGKSKQTNHVNFKGHLPSKIISKSKYVNKQTALRPKDRIGNHMSNRMLTTKLLQAEPLNKRKTENCKSQNAHHIQITRAVSHGQNISTQAPADKQISLCSQTFCKDREPKSSVSCTSKCSSSCSLCSNGYETGKSDNKKLSNISALNYSLRNPKTLTSQSDNDAIVNKNISKQKVDHSKSLETTNKIPLQQNKSSAFSSSKLSNCAKKATTKCTKTFKQNSDMHMDDKELYECWKAETCGKEEKLAFGILRIQGYKAPCHNTLKNKRKLEEEANSSKFRPREFTLHYKGITVKRNPNYTQVIFKLNGRMSGCTHSFLSIEDMVELKETLEVTRTDPSCQVLLLTGSDDYFCSGLDLQPLLDGRKEKAACEMAKAVKELMEALAAFTKPLVIAVNGDAMGLGVTLLTYSDVVLASDNAIFSMPYSQLGYMPEGAATLTLPQVMGVTVAADMLIRGKQLTAHQAQHHGLVSEVIKKDQLMRYAIPRVLALAKQPLHAMEITKQMMRYHLWEKLHITLEKEVDILPRQWLSSACQQAITKAFEDGFFFN